MMKLQKFILCAAVALTAFGASLGSLELGNYVRGAFIAPKQAAIKPLPSPALPTIVPPQAQFEIPDSLPESAPVEEPEHEWSGAGDYYISSAGGRLPKGFEDFNSLSIGTDVWDDKLERRVSVKPFGAAHTYDHKRGGEEYKFSAINLTGKRVSIVTRAVKGISYQFDGKFVDEKIKYKNAGVEYVDDIYLKGRITKWRGGKKIAEAKVNFGIGGC